MFYTYILQSKKDNKNYSGYTKNLKLRPALLNNCEANLTGWKQHNKGRVESTKNRRPFELIYYEACLDEKDAIKREKYFKTHYGKQFLRNRLKSYFTG